MTKFEQVGCNFQYAARSASEAECNFAYSCMCCTRHPRCLHFNCDRCAIRIVHESVMAIWADREAEAKKAETLATETQKGGKVE